MNKKEIAKKNLEEFFKKFETELEEPKDPLDFIRSYVVKRNGSIVEDFYWTDNIITPTAVLKWIKEYNRSNVKQSEWIVEARLEDRIYKELQKMLEKDIEDIIINDVKIVKV